MQYKIATKEKVSAFQNYNRQVLCRNEITLKDIADHANVSISSVSRALNNANSPALVNDQTRLRIIQVAKDLGYHKFNNSLQKNEKFSENKKVPIVISVGGIPKLEIDYVTVDFRNASMQAVQYLVIVILLILAEALKLECRLIKKNVSMVIKKRWS